MSDRTFEPVNDDSIAKVDHAIAVGEDLEFQERWWTFERIVWSFFILLLIADALGVFGRGWLAKADVKQPDSGMEVKYERVMRRSTPGTILICFGPDALQNSEVHLFVSREIVELLGNEGISPLPEKSVLGDGGVTYTFPATAGAPEVAIQVEAKSPGFLRWTLQVPGHPAVHQKAWVMP
jgi:hypothetical protein